MIEGRSVLAVVPARGGSKGIPLKNITRFHGRPLIEWTADFVLALDFVDRSVVSTDNQEIAVIAETAGINCPFERPEHLSGDRISDYEVLIHALKKMEKIDGHCYDVVLMLQPTSPYRKVAQVRQVVMTLLAEGLDTVVTVSRTPLSYHPLKQFSIADGRLNYYQEKGRSVVARQDLSQTYHRNGIAYAITRDCLINQRKVIGNHSGAHIIEHDFINIDSREDLARGESMSPPSF